jgi:hypothetical protein
MAASSRDRITVDLQGVGAALLERAEARRASVSVLVREAVKRELRLVDGSKERESATRATGSASSTVKLSIRLTSAEAEHFEAGARRAGLSRGAFLAGLLANVPSLASDRSSRPDCVAALTVSSAGLSTLSRDISHLTALLRRGQVRAAQEYRRMLDTLGDDVRAHLTLAASVLAELRPAWPLRR